VYVGDERGDQQAAYNHLNIKPPVAISNQWRTILRLAGPFVLRALARHSELESRRSNSPPGLSAKALSSPLSLSWQANGIASHGGAVWRRTLNNTIETAVHTASAHGKDTAANEATCE
jgi:hypothetical protein